MSQADKFRVIGPCEVAGVPPGEVVTRQQLLGWADDVNIGALVGPHLEEVTGDDAKPDVAKAQPQKAAKP